MNDSDVLRLLHVRCFILPQRIAALMWKTGNAFSSVQAAVNLVKNGAMVATVWAESIPYWASASNVAILDLESTDQVWLMLLSRASHLHGYMYSTFSGFLIFEH